MGARVIAIEATSAPRRQALPGIQAFSTRYEVPKNYSWAEGEGLEAVPAVHMSGMSTGPDGLDFEHREARFREGFSSRKTRFTAENCAERCDLLVGNI